MGVVDGTAAGVVDVEDGVGDGDEGQLLMSYGINDCEAKLARMPLREVMRMLQPLAGETSVCVPLREQRPRPQRP